ncbi:MAG: PadR family transcriptional regulator [Gemmatimonadota bacterium]|nr:PadR family transcriptional regulator [Gemmatimonadota bacterium]
MPERPTGDHKSDVLKGTLDMLVLHTLTIQPMHGYAIAQHIKRLTDDALRLQAGSLYPALERLEKEGCVTARWEASPTGRRARYYSMTAAGRKQLGREVSGYDRAVWAIARVLNRA